MNIISESNITNDERSYRNFCNIVKFYCPKVNVEDVKVIKTSKGNWKVVDPDGKQLCLVSRNVLNDALVDSKKLRCECCN